MESGRNVNKLSVWISYKNAIKFIFNLTFLLIRLTEFEIFQIKKKKKSTDVSFIATLMPLIIQFLSFPGKQ